MPELGYSAYQSSEESLHDSGPKKMSGLTKCLLKSINYNEIRKKRIENTLAHNLFFDLLLRFMVGIKWGRSLV